MEEAAREEAVNHPLVVVQVALQKVLVVAPVAAVAVDHHLQEVLRLLVLILPRQKAPILIVIMALLVAVSQLLEPPQLLRGHIATPHTGLTVAMVTLELTITCL